MPGRIGAIVLFHAEEDGRPAAGVVITQLHSMVEKIALVSDHRFKRWNAIQMVVLVSGNLMLKVSAHAHSVSLFGSNQGVGVGRGGICQHASKSCESMRLALIVH